MEFKFNSTENFAWYHCSVVLFTFDFTSFHNIQKYIAMKKILYLIVTICSVFAHNVSAQLIVDSLGHTAIGYETSKVNSLLAVGGEFENSSGSTMTVISDRTFGLRIRNTKNDGAGYGIHILTNTAPISTCGMYIQASKASLAAGSGMSYGVLAFAGNGADGRNYGVFGGLSSSSYNGAGIVGHSNGTSAQKISGNYAGYFFGPVAATGEMTATAFTTSSDARLKRDITTLDDATTLGKLMQLAPVEYSYQQRELEKGKKEREGKVVEEMQYLFDEKSQLFQKRHLGFLAQDVQKIYPDLVYEDGNGYLSVDYNGLIPVLVKSVQVLAEEVQELRRLAGVAAPEARAATTAFTADAPDVVNSLPTLSQNVPNPFNEDTRIDFYLPETVKVARLYVYDMQGTQKDSYDLTARGNASVTVSGGHLAAGMYLYSLIADGRVIDTKRMILTK